MIYVVNKILLKDWDNVDDVSIIMVADNTQDIINMSAKLDKETRNNIFITEIGSPESPLNAQISHRLFDSPGTPLDDFLKQHVSSLTKKVKL